MGWFDLPFWVLPAATFILVGLALESGYRLGTATHKRFPDEKESPVSAIAGIILGLLAFILAITFGMVSERYETRKTLVREEAGAIRTAYFRSDFLPEVDRAKAKELYREYLHARIEIVKTFDVNLLEKMIKHAQKLQLELWDMAVINARRDMNSDVAALYIESINDLANIHAQRVAIGWQTHVPLAMWIALYSLVVFGMTSVGYHTAIAASRRSFASLILALAFTIVFGMIIALDNPQMGMLQVSQLPLEDLRALIQK